MPRLPSIIIVAAIAAAATPAASAQLLGVPTQDAPSYGYQPYKPGTGFYHPNGMGYGSYINPTKQKGHRSPALSYRRFKGY